MAEQKTHWKLLTNPNYLGGYAIPPGQDLIATINHVVCEEVTGTNGKSESEVVAYFYDNIKPMILNKTNLKAIQEIYGTPYIEDWSGCQIQIYYDPLVKFGRKQVGGLRIRPFVPVQQRMTLKCSDCKADIVASHGYTAEKLSAYTHQKYGKELCSNCAAKIKAKLDAQKAAQAPDPFSEVTSDAE